MPSRVHKRRWKDGAGLKACGYTELNQRPTLRKPRALSEVISDSFSLFFAHTQAYITIAMPSILLSATYGASSGRRAIASASAS